MTVSIPPCAKRQKATPSPLSHDELPALIAERFGGVSDTVALGLSADTPAGRVREILQEIKQIPARFAG
jgi:hypothetical protein